MGFGIVFPLLGGFAQEFHNFARNNSNFTRLVGWFAQEIHDFAPKMLTSNGFRVVFPLLGGFAQEFHDFGPKMLTSIGFGVGFPLVCWFRSGISRWLTDLELLASLLGGFTRKFQQSGQKKHRGPDL